jgi:hypothetical protein
MYVTAVSGHSKRLTAIPFPRIPDQEMLELLHTLAFRDEIELTLTEHDKQLAQKVFDFGLYDADGERTLPPVCTKFVLDRREDAAYIVERCGWF